LQDYAKNGAPFEQQCADIKERWGKVLQFKLQEAEIGMFKRSLRYHQICRICFLLLVTSAKWWSYKSFIDSYDINICLHQNLEWCFPAKRRATHFRDTLMELPHNILLLYIWISAHIQFYIRQSESFYNYTKALLEWSLKVLIDSQTFTKEWEQKGGLT